jgi:hypothetical protein
MADMASLQSFLLALCVCFAWAGDMATEERRARCVAHCVDYNSNATTLMERFSCEETTCVVCAKPCEYTDRSLDTCRLECNGVAPCLNTCEFIKNMKETQAGESSLPASPAKPRLVEGTFTWDRDNYEFYKKKKATSDKGVVFLLLGAKVIYYPNGSIDTGNLIWEFIGIRLLNENVTVAFMQPILRFACGQSYQFKVAAINELGSSQYKISHPYTTEELLNMKCDASCMCPSRLASLTQSQLDISSVNPSNHYSLYRWNDNCSDFRASRVIVWNQPNDIQQATKVCYEVHVMAHPTTSNPSCNMKDHVYCIQDDNNQMVLQNLRPGCTVSVAVYSGSSETSKLPQRDPGLELKFTVPQTAPYLACGDDPYLFINLAMKSKVLDKISKDYYITVTWNNPPTNVDSFKIFSLGKGKSNPSKGKEIIVPADESPLHLYSYTMKLKPDKCFDIVVRWHAMYCLCLEMNV